MLVLVSELKVHAELTAYMKEHDLSPLRSYRPILFNGAVFMSMFFALRGMTGAPVESMKTQGREAQTFPVPGT